MVIDFDWRPADSRQFEVWQQHRFGRRAPLVLAPFFLASLALFGASWSDDERTRQVLRVALGILVAALLGAIVGLRILMRRRFHAVAGLAEGTNTLHFSAAGVHHNSPAGIHRYPWISLTDWQLTVGYVVLRFVPEGALFVPVRALDRFGTTPDEAFLAEIAPLVRAGRLGED